ncbi:MAG: hypothetical protein NC388_04580 [Clostridium sp.]|nr:hypothetical protein [Clostridium sp.]
MKIKHLLPLLLLTSTPLLHAQKNAQARKVLDAAAAAFSKGGGISIGFRADSFTGTTTQGSTEGQMDIKGNKFRLQTGQLTTWFDGKTQWSYLHENEEVNVSTPTREEIQAMNPYAFIGLYKKGFNYTLKENTLRGKDVYEVRLTAENGKQEIQEILLDVDKKSYTPMCVRILQGGTWTRIVVGRYADKQKFTDRDFRFDKSLYPDAEVIDLR